MQELARPCGRVTPRRAAGKIRRAGSIVSATRSWPANGRAGSAAATGAAIATQSSATRAMAPNVLFILGPPFELDPFDPGEVSASAVYDRSMRGRRAALECSKAPAAQGPAMEFGILGPLRVTSGDCVLDLGAPAQRALLAVLLAAPGAAVSDAG